MSEIEYEKVRETFLKEVLMGGWGDCVDSDDGSTPSSRAEDRRREEEDKEPVEWQSENDRPVVDPKREWNERPFGT